MKITRIFITIIFLYLSISIPANFAFAQNETIELSTLNAKSIEDMAGTYAFVKGQELSVNELVRQFPDMKGELLKALYRFNIKFGSSVKKIEEIFLQEAEEWNNIKAGLIKEYKSKIDLSKLTEDDVRVFIDEINSRTAGKMDSPFLETLLIYNPTFMASPHEEFLQDYTKILRTKGHPKAKGVDLQIQYPTSWKAEEGLRPNIVQKITSKNGRGSDSIMILVGKLPMAMSKADIKDFFTFESMKNMVPPKGEFISFTPTTLDGLTGGMLAFDLKAQKMGMTLLVRNLHFVTVYEDKMIFIQCSVGSSENHNEFEERFEMMKPLFLLVGNSFILQDRWK